MTRASLRLLVCSLALLACPAITSAQAQPPAAEPVQASPADTAPPASGAADPFRFIRFGAVVEGYYQYNWNRPHDRVNPLRAYDTRGNVFSIQQTALVVESVPDVTANRRFGARVDLQFGQATETVQGSPANEPRPEVYRNVWQAFGSYVFPVGRGLRMDFGKFASNLGFETNYAKDNHHFTRAYLFNFLPFYHGGLRLTLPVRDRVTVQYMLTNGIQQTEDFNNFKSSHITTIVRPASSLTWTTNYFFGQEQPDRALPNGPDGFFRVLDTQLAYAPAAPVSLGLDLTHVTNEIRRGEPALALDGLGAYARYQLSAPAAVALRYERLDDEGLFAGIEQVLHELTATAECRLDEGFLVRLEFRRDWSSERFFTSRIPGNLRTQQTTLLLGGVWWFGNKTGAW